MAKISIGFYHGEMADSYENQANSQGFTLGDKAELFEEIRNAYNMLRINKCLTDSQADKVCENISKQLAKSVKRLEVRYEKICRKADW